MHLLCNMRNCCCLYSSRYLASTYRKRTPFIIKFQKFRSFSSTSTWERAAVRVKDTDRETNNIYLDAIRDTHDPTLHLKTIEDELKGTIGKALGKQGEKIQYAVRLMQREYEVYQTLLVEDTDNHHAIRRAKEMFNDYRKEAIQARWELMVHRQAAGFVVNNHHYVTKHYPIAEALPLDEEDETSEKLEKKRAERAKLQKRITGQLDWWQRVGRWK